MPGPTRTSATCVRRASQRRELGTSPAVLVSHSLSTPRNPYGPPETILAAGEGAIQMYMHTMRLDARPGHEVKLASLLDEMVAQLDDDGAFAVVGQVEWSTGEFFLVEGYRDATTLPLQARPEIASRLLEHVDSSFRSVESTVIASTGVGLTQETADLS